jgi:transketolase
MDPFHTTDMQRLRIIATEIRKSVVTSLAEARSGHLGGSLGLADIFAALYFHILAHQPENPSWPDRDRLILSIGHVAPVFYATLAHAGYFPVEELSTLRKLGSRLQGHPGRDHGLPGIELSAGSLGHGLSVAVGMALTAKLDHKTHRIFSIHGDGELQEGSIWEAAMAASHHGLNNLIAIIDRNGVQIDGNTEDVMKLEPLAAKWESFGWCAIHCNGNDMSEILDAFATAMENQLLPTVIIASTVMGKGVSTIEGDFRWHGKVPSAEQVPDFLRQIDNSTDNR